jgi:ribonuclease HI
METVSMYPEQNWTHVYTDGSKSPAGSGGGYTTTNTRPALEGSFATHAGLSIAEIEARALKRASQRLKWWPALTKNQNIVFFTDSKVNLDAIKEVLSGKKHPTAVQADLLSILQDLLDQDDAREICLQYIPAHVRIWGNERADYLARQGALAEPNIQPATQETAKLTLANSLNREWKESYDLATSSSLDWYREARGNRPQYYRDPVDNLSRAEMRVITNLRLERYATRKYLYRCNLADSPLCQCGSMEDARHLLIDCQLPHRVEARARHSMDTSSPSKVLFGTTKTLKATVQYVLEARTAE